MSILTAIIILLIGIAFFVALGYFIVRRMKKKKGKQNEEYTKALQDFEYVERRYQEDNGQTDPHAILWELSKHRRTPATDKGTGTQGLPQQSPGRQDIPSSSYPRTAITPTRDIRPQGNPNTSLIDRFKRR